MAFLVKYRPVFSSSSKKLGKTNTTAVATFPFPTRMKTVSIPPYRANPPQEKVHDHCVEDRSPVTAVARKQGQPRFGVDYRCTLNKLLILKPWSTATLERNLDLLGSARFISVADVVTAYWRVHVSPDHVEQTASVTNRRKHYFNLMPFDVCNAPWLFVGRT